MSDEEKNTLADKQPSSDQPKNMIHTDAPGVFKGGLGAGVAQTPITSQEQPAPATEPPKTPKQSKP